MRASAESGNLKSVGGLGAILANLNQAGNPMVTLTMSTYQIHTDTEWRFFKVVGRILAAVLTLTACYIHALTIKHAVTPKFWHGFHPKQT